MRKIIGGDIMRKQSCTPTKTSTSLMLDPNLVQQAKERINEQRVDICPTCGQDRWPRNLSDLVNVLIRKYLREGREWDRMERGE